MFISQWVFIPSSPELRRHRLNPKRKYSFHLLSPELPYSCCWQWLFTTCGISRSSWRTFRLHWREGSSPSFLPLAWWVLGLPLVFFRCWVSVFAILACGFLVS